MNDLESKAKELAWLLLFKGKLAVTEVDLTTYYVQTIIPALRDIRRVTLEEAAQVASVNNIAERIRALGHTDE